MADKLNITAQQLRSTVSYDPETGDFFWLPKQRSEFKDDRSFNAWNTRFLGKFAGTSEDDDYRRLRINKRLYFKHQLAWLHFYGEAPDGEIDHIDLNRSNNKITNLRLASHSENMCNTPMRSHNKLRVKGVCEDMGFYKAQLKIGGKFVLRKRFSTIEEAKAAYDDAVQKHHGEFARTD